MTTANNQKIGNTETVREVSVAWSEEEIAFRAFLDDNMSGQDDVKDSLVEILAAIRNPLRDPNAPIFSVLMCGPSTSGKTLGFKLLVQWVHGSRDKMLFVSGSDYEERHQLQKLISAPPGYTGYVDVKDPKYKAPKPGEFDETAILSQHNLDNTKLGCKDDVVFILFDEWEKFHFAFNRFMLRPLREGTGELNNNQPVNFRNVVMGFTSNLGSDELEKLENPIGFRTREAKVTTKDDVRQVVVRELVKGYPPEFRNRINKVLFFAGLKDDEMLRVVDLELKTLQDRIIGRLGGKAFVLSLDESAKLWLLKKDNSADEKSPLPRMQQKMNQHLVGPLGRLVNQGVLHAGDRVEVTHKEDENKLTFFVTADPLAHLASPVDVADDPTPQRLEPANTGVGVGAEDKRETGGALALLPGSGGGTQTESPAEGVEVRHLQPFQLLMRCKDAGNLETVSAAVRAAADALPNTIVTEYTNRMNGVGTADVQSTMEEMVVLRSQFPGLRVIIVGGELS
jgi:AAA domain (Cdc48 subfamily)